MRVVTEEDKTDSLILDRSKNRDQELKGLTTVTNGVQIGQQPCKILYPNYFTFLWLTNKS